MCILIYSDKPRNSAAAAQEYLTTIIHKFKTRRRRRQWSLYRYMYYIDVCRILKRIKHNARTHTTNPVTLNMRTRLLIWWRIKISALNFYSSYLTLPQMALSRNSVTMYNYKPSLSRTHTNTFLILFDFQHNHQVIHTK